MAENWNDVTSNPASGGMFSNILQGLSSGISNNPEQFAIIADAIGRNVAPKNPFAGIGTLMGQSSLADKARTEQQGGQKSFLEGLISNLGGMTPEGMKGVSGYKVVPGKDGLPDTHQLTFNTTGSSLQAPIAPVPQTVQTPQVDVQPITNPQPTTPPQTAINSLLGVYPF